MASTDTTFAIARLAADIHTIGGARAVLGQVAELLRDGYTKLDSAGIGGTVGEAYRGALDAANDTAQRLYAIYAGATPDLFDEEISLSNASQIGFLLEYSREALREIEIASDHDYWDIVGTLRRALELAQKAVEWTAGLVGKAVAAAASPILAGLWPYLLVIVVGAILYFRFARRAIGGR